MTFILKLKRKVRPLYRDNKSVIVCIDCESLYVASTLSTYYFCAVQEKQLDNSALCDGMLAELYSRPGCARHAVCIYLNSFPPIGASDWHKRLFTPSPAKAFWCLFHSAPKLVAEVRRRENDSRETAPLTISSLWQLRQNGKHFLFFSSSGQTQFYHSVRQYLFSFNIPLFCTHFVSLRRKKTTSLPGYSNSKAVNFDNNIFLPTQPWQIFTRNINRNIIYIKAREKCNYLKILSFICTRGSVHKICIHI